MVDLIPRCPYNIAYHGSCGEEARWGIGSTGQVRCARHKDSRCSCCGALATHECPFSGQFVCGAPLCDNCTHTESYGHRMRDDHPDRTPARRSISDISREYADAYAEQARGKGLDRPKREQGRSTSDPTEWSPRDGNWERVQHNVEASQMRSAPWNYGSLADKQTGDIGGIEANARAQLIQMMERQGITPDERGIRAHWQLVMEGYGFPMPEGFIHPEAPIEVKQEGRAAWKRVVEIASDSLDKFLFVQVWRRRIKRLPPPPPQGPIPLQSTTPSGGIKIIRSGEDDVDGEPEDTNDL